MQGQDFPIHVVPFVEQLGAHDTFSSSSSFTRTHTLSLLSLFSSKRGMWYVFYTRERDTKVGMCDLFFCPIKSTKNVLFLSLLFIVLKKCVCDSSFQCCSARVLLLFFPLFHVFDKVSVFFVRWFSALFFEQVVFALALFVVTSESDVLPVVKRYSRLFD